MKTYTPTVARQHLFDLLKQTSKSNQAIQITCSNREQLNNQNYYVLNEKQYDDYLKAKKEINKITMQEKLHHLVHKIVKNDKPINEKGFGREFNA